MALASLPSPPSHVPYFVTGLGNDKMTFKERIWNLFLRGAQLLTYGTNIIIINSEKCNHFKNNKDISWMFHKFCYLVQLQFLYIGLNRLVG
jgi:hypothetical protein